MPTWLINIRRVNNRTHSTLLVADRTAGFTGVVDITNAWSGQVQDPDHWRDAHFKLEGPVIAQCQAAFAREQIRAFEHDLERSRHITLEEWSNHPWTEKLKDRAAGLVRSQL